MDHSYEQRRLPVTQFTEDEEMVRDAARHWANEELRPLVREMDDEAKTRPEIVQGLFDHGFMGMVSNLFTEAYCAKHCNGTFSHFSLHQQNNKYILFHRKSQKSIKDLE